jgi:hypothetical protein
MTLRLFWMLNWLFGPVSFFLDVLWTTMDDERQMIRDLVAGTRLVRNNAVPIGVGKVSYSFYTILCITVLYASVRPMRTMQTIDDPTNNDAAS